MALIHRFLNIQLEDNEIVEPCNVFIQAINDQLRVLRLTLVKIYITTRQHRSACLIRSMLVVDWVAPVKCDMVPP